MSVCVCGAQDKKKVKFADWRSQQRERKVGFDLRFGIRGTVLIGLWGCWVTVKWGGDFGDFFFWSEYKITGKTVWKVWNDVCVLESVAGEFSFLVFFLASTLDSLAEAWLAKTHFCLFARGIAFRIFLPPTQLLLG